MDVEDFGSENGHRPHEHSAEEWAELMARTVAHLAAQLTMTQVRLRALATELSERGGVDGGAVQARVREVAAADTGTYLRENLGEVLVEMIDVDTLESDIVAFLNAE